MSNWQGYLFGKKVTVGTSTVIVPFPEEYIAEESYSTIPDQREQLKAYRDDNTRELFTVTAQGKMSTFSFKTRERLHLANVEYISNWFTQGEYDHNLRAIYLVYWNQETFDYEEKAFYRPNMPFEILHITQDDIIYKSLSFEFIQIKE